MRKVKEKGKFRKWREREKMREKKGKESQLNGEKRKRKEENYWKRES